MRDGRLIFYYRENPDDVPARTAGERIARGVGGGVAAMLAPEAAAGMIARAGPAVAKAIEPLAKIVGRSDPPGDLATTAAAGAASGAGLGVVASIRSLRLNLLRHWLAV
jgi:hypothetical protein